MDALFPGFEISEVPFQTAFQELVQKAQKMFEVPSGSIYPLVNHIFQEKSWNVDYMVHSILFTAASKAKTFSRNR